MKVQAPRSVLGWWRGCWARVKIYAPIPLGATIYFTVFGGVKPLLSKNFLINQLPLSLSFDQKEQAFCGCFSLIGIFRFLASPASSSVYMGQKEKPSLKEKFTSVYFLYSYTTITLITLLTPNVQVFHISSNSPKPVECPRIQLNSNTIYLDIASGPTG